MRVIIAGSRYLTSKARAPLEKAILDSGWEITEVVSGKAKGGDRLGEEWAADHDIPVSDFPADWTNHGKAAGPIRNRKMAAYADALIAIPHPELESRGTMHMIETMQKAGKPVIIVELD
jgi:hypothetical protein